MYKSIIFDFDYTLADATEGIVEAFYYGFDVMNLSRCEVNEIKTTVGLPLPAAFTQLTGIADRDTIETFREHFRIKADEVMTAKTILFQGVVSVLEMLKARGIKTGVVTNKFRYRIDEVLKMYGISHLIDIVIGYEDVQNPKPAPDALLKAGEILGNEILYIGDSLIDAESANRAGIDFIAVTTGTTESFDGYKTIAVIKNLSELERFII
ncbi:MAG: HAD family hydrolase [Oscillospiraceae bacterium]|nr:HAD family hydrolase [Oscillospiraceae bacterium]